MFHLQVTFLMGLVQVQRLTCTRHAVVAEGPGDTSINTAKGVLTAHCARQLEKLLPARDRQHAGLQLAPQLAPLLQLGLLLSDHEEGTLAGKNMSHACICQLLAPTPDRSQHLWLVTAGIFVTLTA